jgi:hypothetical protein
VVCRECRVPDNRSLSLVRRDYGCATCKGKGAVAAERLIRARGFVPLGLKQALTNAQMRFHGATETYLESEIDSQAI